MEVEDNSVQEEWIEDLMNATTDRAIGTDDAATVEEDPLVLTDIGNITKDVKIDLDRSIMGVIHKSPPIDIRRAEVALCDFVMTVEQELLVTDDEIGQGDSPWGVQHHARAEGARRAGGGDEAGDHQPGHYY